MVLGPDPKNPKYFEGVLQLRNPSKEILRFVRRFIDKTPKLYVPEFKKVKNGYDFKVSSNSFLRDLSSKLVKRFEGVAKTSAKLHTRDRQTGKELYRVTLLFICSDFRKNDNVRFRGEDWKITRISNKVELKNLETGRRKLFLFDDFEKGAKLI